MQLDGGGTDENESMLMDESYRGAYFCSVKGRLYMPFVFCFITDTRTFSSVTWTKVMVICMFVPKVWNH
jgi:hypothetical protein